MKLDYEYLKRISKDEFKELCEHMGIDAIRKLFATYAKELPPKNKYSIRGSYWKGFRPESLPYSKVEAFMTSEVYENNLDNLSVIFLKLLLHGLDLDAETATKEELSCAIKSYDNHEISEIIAKIFSVDIAYSFSDLKVEREKVSSSYDEKIEELNKKLEKSKKDYEEIIKEKDKEIRFLKKGTISLEKHQKDLDELDRDLKDLKNNLKEKEKQIKELENTQLETGTIRRKKVEILDVKKAIDDFYDYIIANNLSFSKDDIYNFHTCLATNMLTILAGMSGTGKSRLLLKYAEFFNMKEEDNTLLFIPVSPSYNEPSDILGFLHPNTNNYIPSETGLVEFLKHACDNPSSMHMVIFDEMNLSQIEYWFSPFISILECDSNERTLKLYNKNLECKNKNIFPAEIKILDNVIFVGTINLDETTKNISDRLLDRSFIINLQKESFVEFNKEQRLQRGRKMPYCYDCDVYSLLHQSYNDEENESYIISFSNSELSFLDEVNLLLQKVDKQKGVSFRAVKNIASYLNNKPIDFERNKAFDYAFKQTVMKKINGSIELLDSLLISRDEKDSLFIECLNKYSQVSDFKYTRQEIENKVLELKKYGYTR